jgi:pimeloyl-ACP methyl ester carboxylesterase
MRADIANTGLLGYVGILHHASGLDLRARLSEIAIPTLFVHGSRDTVFRAARIRIVHREIPGARLEEIPDANHVLVFTHPLQVAAKILAFAREDDGP